MLRAVRVEVRSPSLRNLLIRVPSRKWCRLRAKFFSMSRVYRLRKLRDMSTRFTIVMKLKSSLKSMKMQKKMMKLLQLLKNLFSLKKSFTGTKQSLASLCLVKTRESLPTQRKRWDLD